MCIDVCVCVCACVYNLMEQFYTSSVFLHFQLSLSGCGEDMICEPDLELTLNETRYL